MPDISFQDAFSQALARYSKGVVGTPLQQSYRERVQGPTVAKATTFWGATIDVVLPELVSCELHRYGLIEPGLTKFFIDRIGPGSVVFDVGAHLGYYSILASHLGAKAHAFEPSEETLATLRKNVDDKVDVVAKGAWDADTTLELKDFGAEHSAVNTFVSSRDEDLDEPDASYAVPVTTIDRYVTEREIAPDLIKIDAEGAELEVLRGATGTLLNARPIVTIEVGDTEGERRSRATIDFAGSLGYSPFDLSIHGPRPHDLRDTYGYGNIALIAVTQRT